MKKKAVRFKLTKSAFLFIFLVFIFVLGEVPVVPSTNEPVWSNPRWQYRQEIPIPFDTSMKYATYQPIDLLMSFDYPCWARDGKNYSLRVIFQDSEISMELESQIYNLTFSDPTHLSSCNLIFLIPPQASGTEHYYAYYSKDETPSPMYPDHLQITEASYYFAPIPGLPFESTYYKISQDGTIVYGIASNGQFLGLSTAQQITLFKNNVTAVTTPQDSQAFASFDYFYYYGTNVEDFASTIQQLLTKTILIDGNLMVSCGIVSETSREDFRTTAIYKYYYCPDSGMRRIYAHVKHEALKASQVVSAPPNSQSVGNILSLEVGSVKSPSIKELNFGQMYPYLHVYAQQERILTYPQDLNPEYSPSGIAVVKTEDGVKLGSKAWMCYDEGTSGVAHSIILGSTHILVSGTDERDGIQVKAYEDAGPGLLGLHSTVESFCFCRNSYDNGTNDFSVPADFVVEFDADFFSTLHGGYFAVDNESTIFQATIKTRPRTGAVISSPKHQKTYTLRAYVHLAPSVPFGTALSLVTGRNFSYITAELYRQNALLSKDIAGRVSLTAIPTFTGTTFLKKIRLGLTLLNLRSLTLFKKIQFDDLQPGTYLVKIYREHPRNDQPSKFIGFTIITLQHNVTTHIFCRQEGRINLTITDQHGAPVKDVHASLLIHNITVAEATTATDASTMITVPCSLRDVYDFVLLYEGFELYNRSIALPARTALVPRTISLHIPLYSLLVDLTDRWGIPPTDFLSPLLTSPSMKEPVFLTATPITTERYLFGQLYPGMYHLFVTYNSVVLQKNLTIPLRGSDCLNLVLPTIFNITMSTYDARGSPLTSTTIILEREGKTLVLNGSRDGEYNVQLPPGIYNATVNADHVIVGKRKLTVIGDRSFDLVTNVNPLFPPLVITCMSVIGMIGTLFMLRRRDVVTILRILAVILVICSLVLPWWTLEGSPTEPPIETQTHLYILPPALISLTMTPTVIAGERVSDTLPALFTRFILILIVVIIIGTICTMLGLVFQRVYRKKFLKWLYLISIVLSILMLSSFYGGMSLITKVGVGGVFGQGVINVDIPGEFYTASINCQWGLDSGWYLCCVALILLGAAFIISYKIKT